MQPKGCNMPNKAISTTPTVCQYCGKKITKATTLKVGHGSRCAAIQKQFTAAQLQTHYAKISVATTPKGYIKVAALNPIVKANMHKVPGLTISKMVKSIGTDRGSKPPLHPIAQPYYLPNRHRVVHPWLATPAGLQAIATGNWDKAPTPPKVQTI